MASTMQSQILDYSKDFARKAADNIQEGYRKLDERLPEGAAPAIAIGTGIRAVGAIAFAMGRTSSKSAIAHRRADRVADRFFGMDRSPLFKLVKLWMLYRIAI